MTDKQHAERLLDSWHISGSFSAVDSPTKKLIVADIINMRRAMREGAAADVESVLDAHYLNCPTGISHAVVTMLKGISLAIRSAE